ncbi:MAG TPA: cupredoxin domain-containing protein [Chlorobiota bacterium]|nr:cupredoxin domain-containing protein [Chlorobiota bacterium]
MDLSQILVTTAGVATITGISLFFFTPRKAEAMSASIVDGVQHQTIVVKGGYSPNTIHVKAGVPVHIDFDRREASACSDEVVMPDFGIHKDLEAFATTSVMFTPKEKGTFTYTCGMRMLRGTIVVD